MGEEGRGKLVLYSVLLSLLLYGLLKIIITVTGGIFFYVELLFFLLLIVLALSGFVLYNQPWGKQAFFFLFLLQLLNVAVLWYVEGKLFLTLLFLAIIGFLVSLSRKKKLQVKFDAEQPSVVFDEPSKKESPKITAAFTPGKYVASARGNRYHEPKCDWAKKIADGRRIWFRGKEEARDKGYKAHGCVR